MAVSPAMDEVDVGAGRCHAGHFDVEVDLSEKAVDAIGIVDAVEAWIRSIDDDLQGADREVEKLAVLGPRGRARRWRC